VATPEGRLVARLGDPGVATFVRSAAKPFQALPLLLAGGAERFGLSATDLALICASHSGAPEHVARAADLLARGGFTAGDLLCGAHPPLDRAVARRLREAGETPTPLHNNCSGKHAGMLLACRVLDLPSAGYVDPGHPLQQRILDHVARCCGVFREEVGIGVDGCSVPAYSLPIAAAARGYAALADPRAAGLPEGFYGLTVRGPVALGLTLKIADGGERCRDGVVLDLLRAMGSLAGEEFQDLADLYRPILCNHRGLQVGEVVPEVDLEPCDD
jgi:L-asparaginase II